MWFLLGLPARRIGWFVRLHHVVADGIAGLAELRALLDPGPDTPPGPAQPWTPAPRPSAGALLLDNLQHRLARLANAGRKVAHPAALLHRARAAMPALRELLAQDPGPRTSLDRVIGQDRTLALIRGDLQRVNEVARRHNATLNDVLLTVIGGGLRGLLVGRGERVAGVRLPVYVPISLRRGGAGPEAGNLIGQMVVPLPLGVADPVQRLRLIAAETAKRKAIHRPSLGTMFHSRLVRGAMLKLVARQRVNVVSADLAGPRTPLFFAGARLIEIFPLVNLLGTESLGVGALSYAGQFNLMAVADAAAHPDLEVFAKSARQDLHLLVESRADRTSGGPPH